MISAVLLNWKRPENLKKIIDTLGKSEWVSEITVFDNNPSESSSLLGADRCAYASTDFGLYSRFAMALLAKNECVLIQDDDICLSHEALTYLFTQWNESPNRLHGIFGRKPKPDGSYAKDVLGPAEAPICLTRALLAHRSTFVSFFDNCYRPEILSLQKNSVPCGNGEDILLSYSALADNGGQLHRIHNVKYEELPAPHAIHARAGWQQHVAHRTKLMQICQNFQPTIKGP